MSEEKSESSFTKATGVKRGVTWVGPKCRPITDNCGDVVSAILSSVEQNKIYISEECW